jgi:hypothetical protein
MAHFPFTHADIMALAEKILAGLTANPDVYPAPTVDLVDFGAKITSCSQARAELTEAIAMKMMATAQHQQEIADLKGMMRKQLRYAENVTSFDDAKLKIIGWADKRERISTPPGQVVELKAVEQGADYVVLSWTAPIDGGKPSAYKILRRDEGESSKWLSADTAVRTTLKLTDQPRRVDLDYKVIALNKTGEGPESNMVSVVL